MPRLNRRIGIIGSGNMGGAILAGLVKNRIAPPSRIVVYDKVLSKAKAVARQWKVKLGRGNGQVVAGSDVVVLAVKPQDLFEAAAEFRQAFRSRHVLITILAGTPIAKVRRAVGPRPKIVRAMPNLGAQVGEAVTALSGAGGRAISWAETLFSGCGRTLRLPEKYFDLVTAISGSGPAYFFLLMELLVKEARSRGLSEKVARALAVQTALGAGLLAQKAPVPPAALRRQVTSKGGTTEAALRVFQKRGLAKTVSLGIRAAVRRGRELSRR